MQREMLMGWGGGGGCTTLNRQTKLKVLPFLVVLWRYNMGLLGVEG